MKRQNFFELNFLATAFAVQSVGQSASVNGAALDSRRVGRALGVLLVGGAAGTGATATCKLQGQKESDDSWEDLLDETGATLAFTPAKLADAGLLESAGFVFGTVYLTAAQAEKYDNIRVVYARGAEAQTVLVGAYYIVSDLFQYPNPVAALVPDDLSSKQLPY